MPVKKKIVVIIVVVFVLMGGVLKIVDSVAPISPIIFSRLHFFPFEKNRVGAQLIVGENINKYTQIHWADPKEAFEYPERGLTFKFHYEGNLATTTVIDILDAENKKVQSISFPRGEVRDFKWINGGLFLHGTKDVSGSWKETDQDYYYDLGAKEKQPIKSDGQEKCKDKNREWLLHPKNRSYLLETYCLSSVSSIGGNDSCIEFGVSLKTSIESTRILSFYHSLRQRLRIGWDDDNFYVKTRKADVDWGFDEQRLAQEKLNVDRADSGDLMYIIPLKNLDNI